MAVDGPGPGETTTPAGRLTPGSVAVGFRAIGEPISEQPWITDLTLVDLDRDGWLDVVAADGRLSRVVWLRQTARGVYAEQVIGGAIAGPAHVEAEDIDRDGDLDVLVAGMGIIMPNNDKIGSVVVLENDGHGAFANRVLIANIARVTSVSAGDLDGGGGLDLSVGQFGYNEGEVRWMENLGGWSFKSHILLDLSGTIHAPVADIDADGDLDVVALVSQDWEEVYAFDNTGDRRLTARVLHGSTNKDYGSSGLTVADVDGDADPDLLWSNGDGFDYASPGARPWHGLQWLENDGRGRFSFHRIGDFPGAYSPVATDLDADGDLDVVAVSGFNEWSRLEAASLMWFENDGHQKFAPHVLAHAPTHLVVVKGADMDQDGSIDLVTGGFCFYPPYDRASRIALWERKS